LLDKVHRNGIALMAIRDSHHFAALSFDVEPFAEEGLIALSVVNSLSAVVPHGALKPVYGTNPIAFATPREKGEPIVFDMATSVMAKGDVRLAAKEGRELPPGVGVDRHGHDTTDPHAVLDGGALRPFGGHKGSALSMMVEILCAALVGGDFSFEVDNSGFPGAQTPRTGQTIIVIDPRVGATKRPALTARVECLLKTLKEAGQDRFPGDRRREARHRSLRDGIPVSAEMLSAMEAMQQAAKPANLKPQVSKSGS
jgi:delta1-piperideine-2-carboxylate reductase